MNTAELKLELFRTIDSLDEARLKELYEVFANHINEQKDSDWSKLSFEQQQGIKQALREFETGKGIAHKDVMSEFREKYSDEVKRLSGRHCQN